MHKFKARSKTWCVALKNTHKILLLGYLILPHLLLKNHNTAKHSLKLMTVKLCFSFSVTEAPKNLYKCKQR